MRRFFVLQCFCFWRQGSGGTVHGGRNRYESERMPENNAVLNPEPEVAEKQSGYCLTAEDGMLLIFDGTSGEVCFQTHMPLSEFSVEEQEKLQEGVWSDTMPDVFHYLESFSS